MDRIEQLERYITNCCNNSAIVYEGKYPAVKYLVGRGKIVYIEKSRMLDYCEFDIPDYDVEVDELFVRRIMTESKTLRGCESHEYLDCHYTYSFMLIGWKNGIYLCLFIGFVR